MKLIPHGAALEVTGTCHELQVGSKRILLDCGLFQGKRSEAATKNATFTFDPAKDIDAVILSHAHMDHCGRIPLLWKKGYRGPIFCTYATRDLAQVMMIDGGFIQEKDEEFFRKHLSDKMMVCDGPLYTLKDAEEAATLLIGKNYNEWINVCEGVRVQFVEAGHVLGAAMMILELKENGKTTHFGFSGDLGRTNLPIIRDPGEMLPVDMLLCESTYGNRRHEDASLARGRLQAVIEKTAKRGGKVIIPAFSLERTQQIVYELHMLWDARSMPQMPVVIDSPLASKVTDVFMKHPECYDREMYEDFLSRAHNPFHFSLARYTESPEESKALNGKPGPMIIMAGSGMCEAGRIRHHLKNELADPRNTVLAVGYMAQNTLGARIIDPTVTDVKIFDEMIHKGADVDYIETYSGHADMGDLDAYISSIKGLKRVVLVHGEPEQMHPFAERIREKGIEALMPEREQEIDIL